MTPYVIPLIDLVWIGTSYKYYKQRWGWKSFYTELYCQCVFLKGDDISHLFVPYLLSTFYQHVWTGASDGVFEKVMRQKAAHGWSRRLSYGSSAVTHEVCGPFKHPELCCWSCWQTEIAFAELESRGHRWLYFGFFFFFELSNIYIVGELSFSLTCTCFLH